MKNLLIDSNKSIKKALDQISKTGQKCLVVVAKNNKLLGTLSDGDIRRSILKNIDITQKIIEIFNRDCLYLTANNYTKKKARSIFLNEKVDLIPIVNKERILIDILTWEKIFSDSEKINKIKSAPPVVIMAGGKGIYSSLA